jgi:calpain-7
MFTEHYTDADPILITSQPSLSPAQIARSATWHVPSPALRMEATEIVIEPQDIVQYVVSDCSVCAAVSVCVAHERRVQSKVSLLSMI